MATPYDNFNLTNSRYIPQYHGAPVEEFGNLLQKREQEYISVMDKQDIVTSALAQAKVRNEDMGIKQGQIDKVNQYIQGVADKGGALEFEGRNMRTLAREVLNDEKLGKALHRYEQDEVAKADLNKRRASGHLDEAGYFLGMQSIENDYTGVGEKNEAGFYDDPDYYDPMRNINIDDEVRKRISAIRAKQSSTGWTPDESITAYPSLTNKTTTEIKEWEVNKAIENLLSEGDNARFLDQQAKYNGVKGDEGGDSRQKLVQGYKDSYKSSAGVLGESIQHKWVKKDPVVAVKGETTAQTKARLAAELAANPVENMGHEQKITTEAREEYSSYEGNIAQIEEWNVAREELKPALAQTQEHSKDLSSQLAELENTPINQQKIYDLKKEIQKTDAVLSNQENRLRRMDDQQAVIETLHEQALSATAIEMFPDASGDGADLDGYMVQVAKSMNGSKEEIADAIEKTKSDAQIAWRRRAMPTKNMTPEDIRAREEGTLSDQDYISRYAERNYMTNLDNKTTKAFQENLNDLTDGIVVNQPLLTWKTSKMQEEVFTNILTGEGININGMKNGVRVPMEVGMQLKGYQTDNMQDILPEEQMKHGSISFRGLSVRDGNLAFVGTIHKPREDGSEGTTATNVTWGSQAKTNAWLAKYPALKPTFAGLSAMEISMGNPGAEVPIDVSLIDPNGRQSINVGEDIIDPLTQKPYVNAEGQVIKQITALVPYVVSTPIGVRGGEDYLEHRLEYRATVIASPIEENIRALSYEEVDMLLTKNNLDKKLPKTSATQSRIVEILENLRDSLELDDAKRKDDAIAAGVNPN